MSGTPQPTATARRVALVLVAAALASLLLALGPGALASSATQQQHDQLVAGEHRAREAYASLPLAFVPNAGQTDARVRYSAQASGASVYFTRKAAVLALVKGAKGFALRLTFPGANPAVRIEGRRLGTGTVNYVLGSDPAAWRTNLPTYREVVYRDLWPGVDLVFRGESGILKYEFLLRPGAKVDAIRLAYRGAERLSVSSAGELLIQTPLGLLRDERPRTYQQIGGKRVPVTSRFALVGRDDAYGFALGSYDRSRPLVIDPGLLYSTFLGGSGRDGANGIAIDASGNAYVAGFTNSADFPTTTGVFDPSANGNFDAFVSKLNPTGSSLVYSTYLGGSLSDEGQGIDIDAGGNAYVTGVTSSTNFPTSVGAFDTTHNGGNDAFVAKLSPTGSALVYSTYLGGSNTDNANGIAVDAVGSAYVTGLAVSSNFPTTLGAFDPSGGFDAFVTKLNAAGSGLVYSTYLGGTGADQGVAVTLDGAGSAYVTGFTSATDFPTTVGAFDTTHGGGNTDVFVTKLNPAGSALAYSTFLGGSSFEEGFGIAVDTTGSAYVTGRTGSSDFPTTVGAFDTTYNGGMNDAYVTKLNATGSALVYSTYLDAEHGHGIMVDAAGNTYVAGYAGAGLPTTPDGFDTTYNGGGDVFVTKLNPAGSALLYSTYLGGSADDIGLDIAVDAAASIYVTGATELGTVPFPTTSGAFDTTHNGGIYDAFVAKLGTAAAVPATLTLSPAAAVNTVGTSHTVTATVQDAGGQPVADVIVRFTVTGSVTTSGQCTTDASGQCTFTYQGPPLPGADAISAYADSDGDDMQDAGEPTAAATKTWVLPPSTEFCEVKITNGGWFVASNGDRASFGGNARVAADGSVAGQQEYGDHGPAQARNVHSIELTATTCSDDLTTATIFGTATVDGSGTFAFRIDVIDMGEPGTNDSYGILMSDGYASGQRQLQGGNVQIHKP